MHKLSFFCPGPPCKFTRDLNLYFIVRTPAFISNPRNLKHLNAGMSLDQGKKGKKEKETLKNDRSDSESNLHSVSSSLVAKYVFHHSIIR